jgi:hypothetical protein
MLSIDHYGADQRRLQGQRRAVLYTPFSTPTKREDQATVLI